MRLLVRVVPKASREGVIGWLGDELKVRVTAAPERGRANAAVERVLTEALGLSSGRVRVVGGHAARRKVVEIEGLEEAEARRRLDGVDR